MTKQDTLTFTGPPLSPADLIRLVNALAHNDRRIRRPDGVTTKDVEQDAAVFALQVQNDYSETKTPGVTFTQWIYQRVRGMLMDKYGTLHRRAARNLPADAAPPAAFEQPAPTEKVTDERAIELLDLRLDLDEAIKKLPKRQQYVVSALFIENKTQQETADELGVSQATVSQLLGQARLALHGLLAESYA